MNSETNAIDDIIDQVDGDIINDVCMKCLSNSKYRLQTSCNHIICLTCTEELIKSNKCNHCPFCNNMLSKNLTILFTEYLNNPITKLGYYHNIHQNEMLWMYHGNGHNWIYSHENCLQLEEAYQKYQDTDEYLIELQVGNPPETYIIDFDNMQQYPKKSPKHKRMISSFQFKNINDLKKNKIIGVAGKLL